MTWTYISFTHTRSLFLSCRAFIVNSFESLSNVERHIGLSDFFLPFFFFFWTAARFDLTAAIVVSYSYFAHVFLFILILFFLFLRLINVPFRPLLEVFRRLKRTTCTIIISLFLPPFMTTIYTRCFSITNRESSIAV